MNNKLNRFSAAACAALLLSACAHNAAPRAIEPAAPPTPAPAVPMVSISNMPPDVLAVCRQSLADARAGRVASGEALADECLSSASLPVPLRLAMLQMRTAYAAGRHDYAAAVDSQLAAMALTPGPLDAQRILLASLYRLDKRYRQSLIELDRVRDAHENAPDQANAQGPDYHRERGATLAALGRPREALSEFDRAIAMAPAAAASYLERARTYEAVGKAAAARADYRRFARWAPEENIDARTRATLEALGIDAAAERRHPFGSTNPLRNLFSQQFKSAQSALSKAARSPSQAAEAYFELSLACDGMGRHDEALRAIDKAIALAPDNVGYQESKVETLTLLGRMNEALQLAASRRLQADDPMTVIARIHMHRGEWAQAEEAFARVAKGKLSYDQDYLAATYVWLRAKSGGTAPTLAYFEDYIQRATADGAAHYRRALLLYMLGRMDIAGVYALVVRLPDPVAIQNALAETWFLAAARERYTNHDDGAARAYLERLSELQPYGTIEWNMAERGDV
ncbi:Tetratricopeptide repeat-containing protein [Trinickia caryophylli]|uniref:Tetratricopeptide repeat-containing protein n=2 Tax=Trinickia caryophylli TaxID=28094 RepID=A0A1X7GK09_TRICW|nr:Tetratricopeptide repeat-containing protein [Trinickia caryophylli]